MNNLSSLFVIFFVIFPFSKSNFELRYLSEYIEEGAVCIDGSPGAYKYKPGKGDGQTKWMISFDGGGWCFNDKDCFRISQEPIGSSKTYSASPSPEQFINNYFSTSPVGNFLFNWNMILVKYCDGGSFTGNSQSTYNGNTLYFRGSRLLDAFLSELQIKLNASSATDMIISGNSAGGLSALLHVDKFAETFPGAFVVGMPDSGFFLPYDNEKCEFPYKSSMLQMFDYMNSSAGTHKACLAAGLGGRCLFAYDLLPYVSSPIFALQSKHDTWVIGHVLCVDWRSDKNEVISKFGVLVRKRFYESFSNAYARVKMQQPEKKIYHSAFFDNCPHHTHANFKWRTGNDFWNRLVDRSGRTQQISFQSWYQRTRSQLYNVSGENDHTPDRRHVFENTKENETQDLLYEYEHEHGIHYPFIIHHQKDKKYPDLDACEWRPA